MATNGNYCLEHHKERRQLAMFGSMAGAGIAGLFSPVFGAIAIGALIGGFVGASMKHSDEDKSESE